VRTIFKIIFFSFLSFFQAEYGQTEEKRMIFKITSPAFEHQKEIPSQYTCEGTSDNISPALHWSGAPQKTKTFALIVDDPDAPNQKHMFVHWVLANIPATVHELLENANIEPFVAGMNDYGTTHYAGPCPPNGTHRYYFKLYALDATLDVTEGITKEQLLNAMHGHILY
jgi:hypothetical protein